MFAFSRMRRWLPVVALCALMPNALAAPPSAAPVASAQKTEAVKQAIQTAWDAQDAALVAHDLDGVMATYADNVLFFDDLKGTEHQGTAGARAGWVGLLQLPRQTLTAASHQIKTITVSPAGTGATVQTVRHLTLHGHTVKGTPFVTGIDSTLRCFWAKTDAGWRIKQERFLAIDSFLNGKLIRHNQQKVAP